MDKMNEEKGNTVFVAGFTYIVEQIGQWRDQRNACISKIKIVGVVQLIYGVVMLGVAIAQTTVAAQGDNGWPLINPGPWIVSISITIAGAMALYLWKKGEECRDSDETPPRVRKLFFGYWMLCHITVCGFVGWSAGFCINSAVQCSMEDSDKYHLCFPHREANVVLAAVLGAFCSLVTVVVLPTYALYCRNACAFGMKRWHCCYS